MVLVAASRMLNARRTLINITAFVRLTSSLTYLHRDKGNSHYVNTSVRTLATCCLLRITLSIYNDSGQARAYNG